MKSKILKASVILTLIITLCVNFNFVLAVDDNTAGDGSSSTTPVSTPDSTPVSTPKPTVESTPVPTAEPTPTPTSKPTVQPTAEPTEEPTEEPTPTEEEPTETDAPTPTATSKPIQTPKPTATATPTAKPVEDTPEPTATENPNKTTSTGNVVLNTVVKSVTTKEDFTGKGVSSISVKSINSQDEKKDIELTPKFDVNTYNYKCRVDLDVEKIEIDIELIDESWSSEIIGNGKIVEGENIITIISSNDDKTENVTYQINVTKANEVTNNAITTNENGESKRSANKDIILIVCIIVIIVSILIIIITKYLSYKKENKFRREDKDEM